MSRHRKNYWASRVKRTDLKRPCPSGKKGFKKTGDAEAAAPANACLYVCRDCGLLHIADRVSRRERQTRARGLAA